MQLAEKYVLVRTTFGSTGEEGEHIKLSVGGDPSAVFSLSLAQARSLATTLIQQVHRAEVISSMRKTKQEQNLSSLERGAPSIVVPAAQQA